MNTIEMEVKSGDSGFEAVDENGHILHTDTSVENGGLNYGFRPMQLLLPALGSCSGIDVVSILKKQRQTIEHFKIKIPENHRAIYRAIGGAPFLDMNYTVFGEIISGLEVVDKIANAETDSNDRPLKDIKMKITLLKRNEYRRYQ